MPSVAELGTSWGDAAFTSAARTTIYLTGVSSAATRAEAACNPLLGLLVTPASGLGAQVGAYSCYAADNACFTENAERPFDLERWLGWLRRLPLQNCLFATLPDVPFDAAATWERSAPLIETVRRLGFPVALVAQNGLEHMMNLDAQLDAVDALFIGGGDEWKLSPVAAELGRRARAAGLWTHVGRVNSFERLDRVAGLGFDSVDGTYLRFPSNAAHLFNWLEALSWERHPSDQQHRFGHPTAAARAVSVHSQAPWPGLPSGGAPWPTGGNEPSGGFAAEVRVEVSGEDGDACLALARQVASRSPRGAAAPLDDLSAAIHFVVEQALACLPARLRRGWRLVDLQCHLEGALRLRGPRITGALGERRRVRRSAGSYRTSGDHGPFEGEVLLTLSGASASLLVKAARSDGMRDGQAPLRRSLEWLVGESFARLGPVLDALEFEIPELQRCEPVRDPALEDGASAVRSGPPGGPVSAPAPRSVSRGGRSEPAA